MTKSNGGGQTVVFEGCVCVGGWGWGGGVRCVCLFVCFGMKYVPKFTQCCVT